MSEYDILLGDSGTKANLLGNYAFVRGMIESGVQVATCYPGSPTAEMANALMQISEKAGIYFEISTNEKVALEVAATSAIMGRPSVCWMKSVGLNVAADSAVQLSYMTMPGGLVVILGDDPGYLSSQNEQDNRHYARLAYVPFIEPSDPQEVKDYLVNAMKISQKYQAPVFIRATTRNCHQIGPVTFGERTSSSVEVKWDNETMRRDGGYIPLPGTFLPMKRKALQNLVKIGAEFDDLGINTKVKVGTGDHAISIITYGHTFQSTVSALNHLGASAEILKLGVTHPLPKKDIASFLQNRAEVHVLEELDPIIENEIKTLCYDEGIKTKIIGKCGLSDEIELKIGEYDPTRLVNVLAVRLGIETGLDYAESSIPVPVRSPQLCPGCGHRTAFYAVKKALGKDREAFSMADIGCYSLGFLPPYDLGNLLYCMGSGAPAASAVSRAFPSENVISFVGDSTFFHAAMPGIVNAVYNGHRQVIMVMDNGITAMTGHQPNPNSGFGANGPSPRISIDEILKAFGVRFIERVPSYECAKVEDALKRAFEFTKSPDGGVAVVIQEEPCALRRSRMERKAGTLPNPLRIDPDICRNIQNCLKNFSCPAIERTSDQKVFINTDLCIGCASCVQTCPLKEKPMKRILMTDP
ncbi:MAG: thiamine pyrophosphate-dependent enzyme, partial [Deltaproteobacteria bacterium]|nr:thiamine pyrophosphate-dependent enzyme [Deltaproteobacteria bacterium]